MSFSSLQEAKVFPLRAPQGAGKDLEMAVSRIERRQLGESECHCFRGFLGGTGSWLRVSV